MSKPIEPLKNIRVLDLTNVLAGPFCCHQLAHMGADVIKVEVPESGDLARQLGADPDLNKQYMGISFLAQNSGKRSITLNLKSPKGKSIFKKLIKTADVLVENFRPGVMKRLELDYENLKTLHPNIIYCAISGFGQDGPLQNLPAYDQIIQGMSGVMSITGAPNTAPYRVGYPIADTIGGMTAAFAITSALANRQEDKGCFIDISMLESVISTMGWVVSNYLIAEKIPKPLGNDNFTASPSGTFKTGDGLINIAANKQEQFESVCDVLGRTDLKSDTRFVDRQARLINRQALTEQLELSMSKRKAQELQTALNAKGVPAGLVLTVEEALAHPQVAGRGMLATFENIADLDQKIRIARPGIKLDGKPVKTTLPPPKLGTHTDSILAELGYSKEEVIHLHEEQIV